MIKDIKNKNSLIRIQIREYRGKQYLDIRKFYLDKDTEEFKPTPKGISIPMDRANEVLTIAREVIDNQTK